MEMCDGSVHRSMASDRQQESLRRTEDLDPHIYALLEEL